MLRKRGRLLEKAAAGVCREAGARLAENVFLRAMNLNGISAHDGRETEVVATGLPCLVVPSLLSTLLWLRLFLGTAVFTPGALLWMGLSCRWPGHARNVSTMSSLPVGVVG